MSDARFLDLISGKSQQAAPPPQWISQLPASPVIGQPDGGLFSSLPTLNQPGLGGLMDFNALATQLAGTQNTGPNMQMQSQPQMQQMQPKLQPSQQQIENFLPGLMGFGRGMGRLRMFNPKNKTANIGVRG